MKASHLYIMLLAYGLCLTVSTVRSRVINYTEGRNNVHIYCGLSSEAKAQIWKINNSLYDLSSLPSLMEPYIPFGIEIKTVERSINQTTFQCLVPTGDGINVISDSDITTLNVTKKPGYQPPKITPQARIVLDYKRFTSNVSHVTVAWTLEDEKSCPTPLTFTIQSSTCDTTNPIKTWITMNLEYNLPIPTAESTTYFNISLNSKCRATPAMFQLYQNMSLAGSRTVDVGKNICLEVPLVMPNQAHFAAWPNNDGHNICTCPLCQGSNGCSLEDCPCYKSSFAPTWSKSVELNNSPQLCWPNLSKDRNNSHVYFFTEVIACQNLISETPFISTSLVSSVKFQVRAPEPPNDHHILIIVISILGAIIIVLIIVVIVLLIVICKRKCKYNKGYQKL